MFFAVCVPTEPALRPRKPDSGYRFRFWKIRKSVARDLERVSENESQHTNLRQNRAIGQIRVRYLDVVYVGSQYRAIDKT